tara:strand:+ start:170 stop:604 length:435 start_codon:yes stop_codon:yes gene_type:complete
MNRLILIFFVFNSFLSKAQEINWITFEDLPILSKKEAKPVMVFIHTDWCKYCLMQEQNTFTDSVIVSDLNENYYCIKLDGESEKIIPFLNREYSKKGNSHTLSWILGAKNNQLLYPTTVTLSPQFQITNRWVGYISREHFFAAN